MNNTELHKRVEDIFEELCLANESIPIIVEGKNDEEALRKIGVKGEVFRLNTGLSLLDFCERIANTYNEVIILTDWDNKGKQLLKKLKQNLEYAKVKINDKFWHNFRRFCSKEIREVEFLTKFLST